MGQLVGVRLRADAINDRLKVRRIVVEVTNTGCLVIHFGLGRNRSFSDPTAAEWWLDGFMSMIDSQEVPVPAVQP